MQRLVFPEQRPNTTTANPVRTSAPSPAAQVLTPALMKNAPASGIKQVVNPGTAGTKTPKPVRNNVTTSVLSLAAPRLSPAVMRTALENTAKPAVSPVMIGMPALRLVPNNVIMIVT